MGKYWVERMDRVEMVKLDEICKNGWIFSALGGILLRYIKWVDFRWTLSGPLEGNLDLNLKN